MNLRSMQAASQSISEEKTKLKRNTEQQMLFRLLILERIPMKIVVLDGKALISDDLSYDALKQFGDLTVYDTTEEKDIVSRIGDAEIVFANKVPITEEILELCPNIRYIGEMATGFNNIDIEACKKRNITVTNIPAYGTEAVAQHTIALLLELTNHVGLHNESIKKGEWSGSGKFSYWKKPLIELKDKKMGIIGLGRIGQRTALIASALGMEVSYHDSMKKEGVPYPYLSLEELLSSSDVICLHCPLTSENYHLINKETLSFMKPSALLINASRGPLIDGTALAEALNEHMIAGAALDVTEKEPLEENDPLLTAENLILTPHIAWAAYESRKRLLDIGIDNLKQYLDGNTVNQVA